MSEYLSIHKGSKVDDAVTTVRNNDCLVKYGNFIGTLSDQSDLQLALNAKVDKTTTINGYALSNSISLVPNDVNAADRNMSNLTETGVVKLRTYCLSTTGGTINGNEAITGTLTVTGATTLNGVTAVNNNFSVGGSITSTLKSTKINSTGSDGVLTASVTRGGYADMVTTTDAGNSNKRCATIRMNNSDSSHSITLGVHDYNDNDPSGLIVSRGVNDSTNTMTMTGNASITGALNVSGNTTMTGVTFTGNINGITPTEFGYLDGVTSNIQTQLDGKVSKSGDTLTGTLTATSVFSTGAIQARSMTGDGYGQIRIINENNQYGVILRADGDSFWILPTASGSPYGTWAKTSTRMNLSDGVMYLNGGNGVYLKTTYVSGTSGYNIWTNGYCEQWGRTGSANSGTVNFSKRFSNNNYSIIMTELSASSDWDKSSLRVVINSASQISWNRVDTCNHCWVARGYLASGQY